MLRMFIVSLKRRFPALTRYRWRRIKIEGAGFGRRDQVEARRFRDRGEGQDGRVADVPRHQEKGRIQRGQQRETAQLAEEYASGCRRPDIGANARID